MSYRKTLLSIALVTVACALGMILAPDIIIDMMGRIESDESSTVSTDLIASNRSLTRLLGSFMLAFGVMTYVLREVQEPRLRRRIIQVAAASTLPIILCSTPAELGWPPLTLSLLCLGILLLGLYQLDKRTESPAPDPDPDPEDESSTAETTSPAPDADPAAPLGSP